LLNPSKPQQSYANINLKQKKTIKKNILKFDYFIFKIINSGLKLKLLNFLAAPFSYFDAKNFNLSFLIILIISIIILWKNKKEHFWVTFALMLSVIAVGGIVVYSLKHHFKRYRPLQMFGSSTNVIYEKAYTYSFPSGHAELIFSLCTFMFIMVRKYWYLYVIFALASGFYRIYAGAHFPSDVLAGALIGIFCAYVIVILFRKYQMRHKRDII
jgi:undecaprenyl-diphosphatase